MLGRFPRLTFCFFASHLLGFSLCALLPFLLPEAFNRLAFKAGGLFTAFQLRFKIAAFLFDITDALFRFLARLALSLFADSHLFIFAGAAFGFFLYPPFGFLTRHPLNFLAALEFFF